IRAEIASESLVSIPEEGAIDLREAAELFSKAPENKPAEASGGGKPIGSDSAENRRSLRIRKVGEDLLEVEFQPFQVSDGDVCEFLLAFSRPLPNFERVVKREGRAPRLALYHNGAITDQPYL